MRYLFIILIVLFGSVSYGQTVGQFRYDSTKFLKVGGYNEVIIQNRSMDSTGGLFTNVGGGLGRWIKPKQISGGIIIGLDTFYISGGGGVDSAYIDIFPIDSTGFELVKSNGKRDTVIFTGIGGGGGGGTADTIYTKFPLRVDTTGVNDSLKIKYPPNSVAVNLTNDTSDVQFLTIKRVSNQVLPDTVRWVATTTIPSGTPEIYYSWSQLGKQVTVKIWAYYPTAGTAVTSAAINLPSDCPAPLVPGGWTTEAEMIVSVGAGGLFVNRTRSLNDLPTANASSVLRRNTDNTGWEIITKMSGGSYRYLVTNMIYEAK